MVHILHDIGGKVTSYSTKTHPLISFKLIKGLDLYIKNDGLALPPKMTRGLMMSRNITKGLAAPGGAVPGAVAARAHQDVAGRVGRLSGQKFRSMPGASPDGYGMETG